MHATSVTTLWLKQPICVFTVSLHCCRLGQTLIDYNNYLIVFSLVPRLLIGLCMRLDSPSTVAVKKDFMEVLVVLSMIRSYESQAASFG